MKTISTSYYVLIHDQTAWIGYDTVLQRHARCDAAEYIYTEEKDSREKNRVTLTPATVVEHSNLSQR